MEVIDVDGEIDGFSALLDGSGLGRTLLPILSILSKKLSVMEVSSSSSSSSSSWALHLHRVFLYGKNIS